MYSWNTDLLNLLILQVPGYEKVTGDNRYRKMIPRFFLCVPCIMIPKITLICLNSTSFNLIVVNLNIVCYSKDRC